MLEDGTIEYDFYYRERESAVYPALDRRAFVIGRDGVRQHWITDGAFDRTGMSPLETSNLALAPTKLRDNDWNRLRLIVTGDVLELVLNEQSIYRGPIDPASQRTFGLFHWGEQTEARVRNIVWRGDWPKSLPPVDEQELATHELAFLDERLPGLTATFEHDFAEEGLPDGMFDVVGKHSEATVLPDRGARLLVRGAKGYAAGWLSPRLQLHGDFDVQARFADLQTTGPIDSSNGIFLKTVTDDPERTQAGVFRGTLRRPGKHDRQIAQTQFNRDRSGTNVVTFPGETAEESTSGTLRLARRGNLLYCLLAENDSQNFRLIHTEKVASEATIRDGLRLMNSVYSILDGEGTSAVTWQRIAIRAELLTSVP
ncbi:DUF1583 domain-containing protein [bacterium]|nr:DUF1583 domain-containing protein [bacterium]